MKRSRTLITCIFQTRQLYPLFCPSFQPQIASIEGLYRVSDHCELHSPTLTTVANRKKTIVLTKENVLQDTSLRFSDRTPLLKIRKGHKKRVVTQVSHAHSSTLWNVIHVLPFVMTVILSIIVVLFLYKKFRKSSLPVKHISVP